MDLNIKNIQDNLTNNQAREIDFLGNVNLVVTKDNIYIKKWETGDISIPNIQLWNHKKRDNYLDYKVLEFEDYTLEELNKVIEETFKTCNYTIKDDYLY